MYKMITSMNFFTSFIFDQVRNLAVNSTVLAQYIHDPDTLGQIQNGFSHFIQSGQAWALLIGLVIGYIFRSFTSF